MRASDFAAAWAVNDAVLATRNPAQSDDPALPYHLRWVWDGRPLDGRRVLVRCYHGLGDTIQFARYLAPLRARAAHVTLEVQAELVPLLQGMADCVTAFDSSAPLPPAEIDVEIMELAHALRLKPEAAPYLRAAPSSTRGIGLCWQSGSWDTSRSIQVGELQPLRSAFPGQALITLQRGDAAARSVELGAIDPLQGSMDILEMASLIAGLDVVVTVDTMIAHLAGALGVPTVVLVPHRADWRWGVGSRCCWYSGIYIVRQPSPGLWKPAVKEAVTYVESLAIPAWA